MSQKVFNLIFAIITGLEAISIGIVTFCNPTYCVEINTAIPIVTGGIIAICKLFIEKKDK